MAASDVEHWQCDKTLQQCMAYMFDHKILCDVTFLLGKERLEVHAHKYMLASRSPVFHAMLDGPMAERGKIEIPDIEKDIFQVLLRYVYTDAVLLTVENVLQVMYAAMKYCIDLLKKECKVFVQKNITYENACILMDSASTLQGEEVYKSCLEKVKHNTEACIRGPGFLSISRDTLKTITELDEVTVQEETLYEQVMKWCDAECGRQHLEITWENKRKVLGDILYDIRFPLMNSPYFAKEIAEYDLLTDKEKVAIMCYHSHGIPRIPGSFNYRERCYGKVEKVVRFPSRTSSGWSLVGKTDAIGFKLSHDSKLYGILLYGSTFPCKYTVQVLVRDSSEYIHNTTKSEILSNEEVEMHEIRFQKSMNISAHKLFHVELLMIGRQSKSGTNGKTKLPFANSTKEVTFFASELSRNGTNVYGGQIPGLLLI